MKSKYERLVDLANDLKELKAAGVLSELGITCDTQSSDGKISIESEENPYDIIGEEEDYNSGSTIQYYRNGKSNIVSIDFEKDGPNHNYTAEDFPTRTAESSVKTLIKEHLYK